VGAQSGGHGMADPTDKNLLPGLLAQNPSLWEKDSQDHKRKVQEQVERVMTVFRQLIPSNYVSNVPGPFYMTQFQSAAEQIADFQITAQEVFADSFYDFTRSEVLYQILGDLVFPDARTYGYPELEGDLTYRVFLQRMVVLLLRGATTSVQKDGVELLTTATVQVLERGIEARKLLVRDADGTLRPTSAWAEADAFTFEINISQVAGTVEIDGVSVPLYGFPEDPFKLQRNVYLVLRALKPAHALYDYRHLFLDTFGEMFSDVHRVDMSSYYYQDFRRYCLGAKRVAGTAGITWANKTLFSDHQRDFTGIDPTAMLTILSGLNSIHVGGTEGTPASQDMCHVGRYEVLEVKFFVQDDQVARQYTTFPTGLTGSATVSGDELEDTAQLSWHTIQEGEILTLLSGPNAGSYRLKTVLGQYGGPAGSTLIAAPATGVKVAPSILRLRRRMGVSATGQSYEVQVDRLGVQEPRLASQEDATVQFLI